MAKRNANKRTDKRTDKPTAIVSTTSTAVTSTLRVDEFVNAHPDGFPGNVPSHGTRNHGKYSNMAVAYFQRWVLSCTATEPHTDTDIGRLWEREHPYNVAYKNDGGALNYVASVRTQYNHGNHAKSVGPPTDERGRWNPAPVWSADGVPTYPTYPPAWLTDGKPNGNGPPPDGVNVTV
jgi:hypothetical protein